MLERFARAKAVEISRLGEMKRAGTFPPPWTGARPSMEKALLGRGPGAVIAEYKRASPSKGEINLALRPEDAAMAYKDGGASALSVLTEEKHFLGRLEFLDAMAGAGLPMLRKDFIFDPLQVEQTAATPASAMLLIVRMVMDPVRLRELSGLASLHGIESVFEIFGEDELEVARASGARIVQVNNRDLDTLGIDPTRSERLIARRRNDEVWISASGISAPEQVGRLRSLGFDGLLVGTSLMTGGDPVGRLRTLLGAMP
jgi:indole-3-glycerol phosphate synthase